MEEDPQSFDICIVCALYEEASAVIDEFSTRCGVTFTRAFRSLNRLEYRHATIRNRSGEPLTVFVTWLSDMGPIRTALDLGPLWHEIRPRFVAMTGVCAGDRRKVRRGDLIVVADAYHPDEGKITSEASHPPIHQPATRTAGMTTQVLQYVRGFDSWKAPVRELKRQHLTRAWKATDEPRCHIEVMASSMAVRADNPFPQWTAQYHRKTVGVDMEAATFYTALRDFPLLHGLVVKGVSDYGDPTKNDRARDFARRASAVYLLHFIQDYVTEETMPRRDIQPSESRTEPPGVWNVPYLRNPHFTGREDLLERLDQQLRPAGRQEPTTTRRAALTQAQAIKGLGGIGKTQIAVEYAYRSREEGRYTHTLWVNAADEETIITSFVTLAELLPNFPAKGETDQRKVVRAIKRWLEHCQQHWLLIFDNADDLAILPEYLPQGGHGSILLTTRAHGVGSLAASLEVEKMSFIEGTELLLRRAQRFAHATDEEINEAGNIVVALDHFPLALDQAGAYIEETQCGFGDYLAAYQAHRRELLARRGTQATNYPDSVATTWSLSFHKVEHANPAAAELLRLCAFLAPDAIPLELIKNAAPHWSAPLRKSAVDQFLFDQMIALLQRFSLVKRSEATETLSLHRLVQAVLIDAMKRETQRRWAKRVVVAVDELFPDANDVASWPRCLRYLSQVQACYTLLEHYSIEPLEAARLLNQAGMYLVHHALYTVALLLIQRALAICERQLGPEHPDCASSLNNLAVLYRTLGKYAQAEPLYQRALAIREQQLGADHPKTALSLNNLAVCYQSQGKYAEAEPLFRRALNLREQQLGPDHPDTAQGLSNLAGIYRALGKYAEAEPLFVHAIAIREQRLGADHPDTANSLGNLALLYQEQGKYSEAESLYRRALAIREQQLGPDHPDTAQSLNNLAVLYDVQGKYAEAEPLYRRALAIREQLLGAGHPHTILSMDNLAGNYRDQGKYAEAEPLYRRVLSMREHTLEPHHADLANTLHGFAALREAQGDLQEAVSLYQRALTIREHAHGLLHPKTTNTRKRLCAVLVALGRTEEAAQLDMEQSRV